MRRNKLYREQLVSLKMCMQQKHIKIATTNKIIYKIAVISTIGINKAVKPRCIKNASYMVAKTQNVYGTLSTLSQLHYRKIVCATFSPKRKRKLLL